MLTNGKWLRSGASLLVLIVIAVAIVFIIRSPSEVDTVNVSVLLHDIQDDLSKGHKDILSVGNNTLTLTRGLGPNAHKESATINDTFDVTTILKDNGINYANNSNLTLQYESPSPVSGWVSFIGSLIPFILIAALLIFVTRQAQGSNNQALSFGKSRARMFMGNKPSVTFADVAGVEEAKQELQEIVEFLKYPEKFVALGARIPKGLLLVGPPGTGKTLIARAVAGQAGVAFFSSSGSEFVEMFVGVGASRVRDLFDQAK